MSNAQKGLGSSWHAGTSLQVPPAKATQWTSSTSQVGVGVSGGSLPAHTWGSAVSKSTRLFLCTQNYNAIMIAS